MVRRLPTLESAPGSADSVIGTVTTTSPTGTGWVPRAVTTAKALVAAFRASVRSLAPVQAMPLVALTSATAAAD
jgi:hypothetical protein